MSEDFSEALLYPYLMALIDICHNALIALDRIEDIPLKLSAQELRLYCFVLLYETACLDKMIRGDLVRKENKETKVLYAELKALHDKRILYLSKMLDIPKIWPRHSHLREVRNIVDHYGIRLDEFFLTSKEGKFYRDISRTNIRPAGIISALPMGSIWPMYDPERGQIKLLGKIFDVREAGNAIRKLHSVAVIKALNIREATGLLSEREYREYRLYIRPDKCLYCGRSL